MQDELDGTEPAITVRQATEADINDIVRLANAVQLRPETDTARGFLISGFERSKYEDALRYREIAPNKPHVVFLVALATGGAAIIGFLFAYNSKYAKTYSGGRTEEDIARRVGRRASYYVLKQIVADPHSAIKGVGRALVRALLDSISCDHIFSAVVTNPPNPASSNFHKKLGFLPLFESISRSADGVTYPNKVWYHHKGKSPMFVDLSNITRNHSAKWFASFGVALAPLPVLEASQEYDEGLWARQLNPLPTIAANILTAPDRKPDTSYASYTGLPTVAWLRFTNNIERDQKLDRLDTQSRQEIQSKTVQPRGAVIMSDEIRDKSDRAPEQATLGQTYKPTIMDSISLDMMQSRIEHKNRVDGRVTSRPRPNPFKEPDRFLDWYIASRRMKPDVTPH